VHEAAKPTVSTLVLIAILIGSLVLAGCTPGPTATPIRIASGAAGHVDRKGGVNEASGVDFTKKAMATIQTADAAHHLVTLSQAGVYPATDPWTEYYRLASLDFVEIHPLRWQPPIL
jgi:hypothetical protein